MTARPVLAGLCLLALLPTTALARDALHGKWSATVTPDEGTAGREHADTLTFTNGFLFSSAELAKQGYEPTAYQDRFTPTGAAATFEVTQKDKAGDTAHWQATDAGGQMTGTLVITPKDGAPASYTFTATRG